MSNKTYNSPEEVAAALPEEIAKNYLATVGTLSFQTPHTLFEGVRRAYFNSPHIYGNYWIDVLKRVSAGEFDPKGEETSEETQNGFDPTVLTTYPQAEQLPEDTKRELIGKNVLAAGNVLITTFISCGLKSHIQRMFNVEGQEFVLTLRKMQSPDDKGPLSDICINEFLDANPNPKNDAPLPTLDQIKDEVAKSHGHKSWATYTGDEGLGRYNREKQLLDKCDEFTLRYASAVSAHERQRAERAEKEVERLKNMLQTSASFLRLGNGADPGKVTHLLEEIGDTLAQKGEGNG